MICPAIQIAKWTSSMRQKQQTMTRFIEWYETTKTKRMGDLSFLQTLTVEGKIGQSSS
jgi:hypothetical protein